MKPARRLDLALLRRGLQQLDAALAEYAAEPARRAFRDSVVIHFLLTYELSIQAIKRFLELQSLKDPELGTISLQTMIRRADAHGLLRTGWPGFGKYRDARNLVAHTYNEERALSVAGLAQDFAAEAHVLLHNLEKQLADAE